MNQTTVYENVKSVLAVSPTQSDDPMLQTLITAFNSQVGICVTNITYNTDVDGKQKVVFGMLCDDMGHELLHVIYRDLLESLSRLGNVGENQYVLNPRDVRLLHRPDVLHRPRGNVIYDSTILEFVNMDTAAFNMMFALVLSANTEAVARWKAVDQINGMFKTPKTK